MLPQTKASRIFPKSSIASLARAPSKVPYCYFLTFIHGRHCSFLPQPCLQQVFLGVTQQHSLSERWCYCSLVFGNPPAGDPPCGRIMCFCSVKLRHGHTTWFDRKVWKEVPSVTSEQKFWQSSHNLPYFIFLLSQRLVMFQIEVSWLEWATV